MPLVFNYKRTIQDVLWYTPMGSKRRQEIIAWFNDPNEKDQKIWINRRWCRSMKLDTDLQKLVKSGFLVQRRGGMHRSGHSYLEKK